MKLDKLYVVVAYVMIWVNRLHIFMTPLSIYLALTWFHLSISLVVFWGIGILYGAMIVLGNLLHQEQLAVQKEYKGKKDEENKRFFGGFFG